MAKCSYLGNARIEWGNGLADTEHFIVFDGDTGTLRVYPLECEQYNATSGEAWKEYIGQMGTHPAAHIVFLHRC